MVTGFDSTSEGRSKVARLLPWARLERWVLTPFVFHQAAQPSAQSPTPQNQSLKLLKGPRLEQRDLPAQRHLGALLGGPTCKAWSPAAAGGC